MVCKSVYNAFSNKLVFSYLIQWLFWYFVVDEIRFNNANHVQRFPSTKIHSSILGWVKFIKTLQRSTNFVVDANVNVILISPFFKITRTYKLYFIFIYFISTYLKQLKTLSVDRMTSNTKACASEKTRKSDITHLMESLTSRVMSIWHNVTLKLR